MLFVYICLGVLAAGVVYAHVKHISLSAELADLKAKVAPILAAIKAKL